MSAVRPALPAARPTVRLGFLGLGWIGRKRLDSIAEQECVEIAALADSDDGKLGAAAERHPGAHVARDLEGLLACDLDGVVIATPNVAHAGQAIACLSRELPVFCQKPLAVDGAQAREVIAAAQAADCLLGVDFCYRYVCGMRELRRRIAEGRLGDILGIDLTFHNAYGPDKAWAYDRAQSGGGALLDLGVHLLDLALWLQASPAMTVVSSRLFAHGRPLAAGSPQVEDMAYAELAQENGAIVRLACSWNAHAGCDAVIGLDVFGSRGGAAWRNVHGSFYDFTLDVFQGRRSERLAQPPDDWGARALDAWIERLRVDGRFDEEASQYAGTARLIDEIYAA